MKITATSDSDCNTLLLRFLITLKLGSTTGFSRVGFSLTSYVISANMYCWLNMNEWFATKVSANIGWQKTIKEIINGEMVLRIRFFIFSTVKNLLEAWHFIHNMSRILNELIQ